MKTTLTILFALILISCETEQEPCICENAKFYIPRIDQKSEDEPPPLGINYFYIENCELNCETGLPLVMPSENARYIGCY